MKRFIFTMLLSLLDSGLIQDFLRKALEEMRAPTEPPIDRAGVE